MSVNKQSKRTWLICILAFAASALLMIILSPLRGVGRSVMGLAGFRLSFLVSFLVYSSLTVILAQKLKNKIRIKWLILALLLGAIAPDLFARILHFKGTLISLPDFLGRIVAILLGWWLVSIKTERWKIVLAVLSFVFCLWVAYFGYDLWTNKVFYDTATGKVDRKIEMPVVFRNDEGVPLRLEDLKSRYTVMDFWYTNCGVCYREFPKVQEFYDEIKDSGIIDMYSVHCRLSDEDDTTGSTILAKYGYTFPNLNIFIRDQAIGAFGITAYPTVLIFDDAGTLLFRGNIDNAARYTRKLLRREVMQ